MQKREGGKKRLVQILQVVTLALGALAVSAWQLPIDTAGYVQGSGPGGSRLEGATITNWYPTSGPKTTEDYSGSGTNISVTAPQNEDGNEREAFWFSNSPLARDEESCSTWQSSPGSTQQGAMLLVTQDADGVIHGIAVVDNIYGGSKWLFNLYAITGDTRHPIGDIHEGYNLSALLGGDGRPFAQLPWHECARTFNGNIQFVVWTGDNPEPAYGTPGAGGSFPIPFGYAGPGKAGWYIGHLPAGTTARFTGLKTTDLDLGMTAAANVASDRAPSRTRRA